MFYTSKQVSGSIFGDVWSNIAALWAPRRPWDIAAKRDLIDFHRFSSFLRFSSAFQQYTMEKANVLHIKTGYWSIFRDVWSNIAAFGAPQRQHLFPTTFDIKTILEWQNKPENDVKFSKFSNFECVTACFWLILTDFDCFWLFLRPSTRVARAARA